MEGLYATQDMVSRRVQLCAFPFGSTACRKELERLRRVDTPRLDDIVQMNPIESIPLHDRPAAYHFLLRATFMLLDARKNEATPYLMAFSLLSNVRFAYIQMRPEPTGMDINMTVLDEIDFAHARQKMLTMAPGNGTHH